MGAPKQKWTHEEEEALKAGIVKHGHGKWRTILKDPEFSGVLSLRSNVDLKDKWRNMVVATNGSGSRERGRVASKRSQQVVKHNETESDGDKTDVKPLDTNNALLHKSNTSEYIISRLDNLVLKAIASLKEPRGSNRTNIAMYIEDQYDAPPNFNVILSEKLKSLTASGKLIKVNHKYRIAPSAVISEVMMNSGVVVQEEKKRDLSGAEKAEMQNVTIFPNDAEVVKIRTPTAPETARTAPNAVFSEVMKNSEVPLQEGRQRTPSRSEKVTVRILTASQVEAELEKMRTMTAQEAAVAAFRAVAEAEAAIEEAEAAAKDAEAAEADADAAQAFAEAAMATWKNRNTPNLMIYA